MPYAKRSCEVCLKTFVPAHRSAEAFSPRCPECRRAAVGDVGTGALAVAPHAASRDLKSPLVQAVFDLETWGLDRGWGVLMCASILIHRGGEPEWYEFDLTQGPAWAAGRRSDDEWLAGEVLKVLDQAHVLYAHNGEGFDVRWLRTLSLKYSLPWNEKKLIDPARIAWAKYAIGRNNLGSLAEFLFPDDPSIRKMPVPPDVWRHALLDADPQAWQILKARCKSDVEVLNAIAGRVTRDVGMIDTRGSAFGR